MKKIIHKLFAPFRAIKNKSLDAIIKRLKITTDSVSDSLLYKLPDFEHDLSNKVLDKISIESIAYHVDYHALGYEIDTQAIAQNIDSCDIAYEIIHNNLTTKEIAEEIDLNHLADVVKQEAGIDLEAINSRLDEMDAKQVDDSKYNDLVKTVKELEAFVHEMQDEHKENYVRHTNRFERQDEDLNRIETEIEEQVIRLNKDMHQAHLERNKLYEKTEKFVSRQWILDAIEARAIGIDEEINELKKATISNTLYLPKVEDLPQLKGYRVTFMDDFEAINEEEAYEKLIHYCEEVYKNQDVTAFNFEEINE